MAALGLVGGVAVTETAAQAIEATPIMEQENDPVDTSSIPEVTPAVAPIMDWFSSSIILQDKPSEIKTGDYLDDRPKGEVSETMHKDDDIYNLGSFTI